jgi:hypothetical protein
MWIVPYTGVEAFPCVWFAGVVESAAPGIIRVGSFGL